MVGEIFFHVMLSEITHEVRTAAHVVIMVMHRRFHIVIVLRVTLVVTLLVLLSSCWLPLLASAQLALVEYEVT